LTGDEVTRDELIRLLERVAARDLEPKDALAQLSRFPYEELGFAKIDHHRNIRRGFPEVIFAEGKQGDQIVEIVRRMVSAGSPILVTRISPEKAQPLMSEFPDMEYNQAARTISRGRVEASCRGSIVVLTAGTSDIPVAEEAAVTARVMGNPVDTIYDVGVAGLHRLIAAKDALEKAKVAIVVAGMEGALASVIGGIVDIPVIGVPTSIGYGASFGGVAALLSMLNSCSGGVSVVNIDNGFGAAMVATLINRESPAEEIKGERT
jgi:pyridinium-3,5-biscarboxylic acid mononucleotide synthase